jgi:hypothetical protein
LLVFADSQLQGFMIRIQFNIQGDDV